MKISIKFLVMIALSFFSTSAFANNLHLIDENTQSGFAIYRTGKPNLNDYKELCRLGVEQMIVLSGTAASHELKYQSYCPQMKVIYNVKQNASVPLSQEFLGQFDEWVANAKAQGKKIAFRCECGCHRTGRLAAYYQMKYQHVTVDDALALMNDHGKWMILHRNLIPQVRGLSLFLKGQACTLGPRYCVKAQETAESTLAANSPDEEQE